MRNRKYSILSFIVIVEMAMLRLDVASSFLLAPPPSICLSKSRTTANEVRNTCDNVEYAHGRKHLSSTVVSMGLRSFISKRVEKFKRKDEDENEDDFSSSYEYVSNIYENEEEVEENNDVSEHVEVSSVSISSSRSDSETVAERISRMKAGGLTNEEKEAFLSNALSRNPSFSNSSPSNDSPPIRQEPPPVPNTASVAYTAASSMKTTSSSFPTDSLWDVIGGNAGASQTDNDSSSKDDMTESQKQAWFNMVTSPERFGTIWKDGQAAMQRPEPPQLNDVEIAEENDEQAEDPPLSMEQESQTFPPDITEQIQDEQVIATSDSIDESKNLDLAGRLEQAAIREEHERKEKNRQQQLKAIQQQKELEEQERQYQILMEKQQAETLKQQEELMERKRQEMELEKQKEDERLRVEQERMKLLELAQEEYWKKKLEEEEKIKNAKMTQREQAQQKEEEDARLKQQQQQQQQQQQKQQQEAQEQPILEQPSTLIESKQDAPLPKSEPVSKEASTPKVPLNVAAKFSKPKIAPIVNNNEAFLMEQTRKKQALDEMLERQRQQLNQLNSPLPSPTTNNSVGVRPFMNTTPAKTNSNISTPISPRSTSIPETQPSKPLQNVSTGSQSSNTKSANTPRAPPKIPVINWGDLGKKSKSPKDGATKPLNNGVQKDVSKVQKSSPPATKTQRLSLKEMTMFKGGTTKNNGNQNNNNISEKANDPSVAASAPKQTVSSPKRKGPIRQQISFSDDDDDDDNDYVPPTPKKQIEFPEEQKAKANKWGINLDLLK